jgi:hypothetical protein
LLFNPTRDQVRQFFIDAWNKRCQRLPATAMDIIAADWISEHPEYHALMNAEALTADYRVDAGMTNPFLHLSMHVSITEQVSINQPAGIQDAIQRLSSKLNSEHEAHHVAMDCLGEMLWTAQRSGQAPDGEAYVACVMRKATK